MLFNNSELIYLNEDITLESLETFSNEIYFSCLESSAITSMVDYKTNLYNSGEITQESFSDTVNKYWEKFKEFAGKIIDSIKKLIDKTVIFFKRIFKKIGAKVESLKDDKNESIVVTVKTHEEFFTKSGLLIDSPFKLYKNTITELDNKYKNSNFLSGELSKTAVDSIFSSDNPIETIGDLLSNSEFFNEKMLIQTCFHNGKEKEIEIDINYEFRNHLRERFVRELDEENEIKTYNDQLKEKLNKLDDKIKQLEINKEESGDIDYIKCINPLMKIFKRNKEQIVELNKFSIYVFTNYASLVDNIIKKMQLR